MTEPDLESLADLPIMPLGLAGIYVGEEVDAVIVRIGEPLVRRPGSDAPDDDSEFLEFGPFVVVGPAASSMRCGRWRAIAAAR